MKLQLSQPQGRNQVGDKGSIFPRPEISWLFPNIRSKKFGKIGKNLAYFQMMAYFPNFRSFPNFG